MFYGNDKPTILCEGKTDDIYLKSAISALKKDYPRLAGDIEGSYKLLVRFVKYTKRTRFFLQLHGGSSYLNNFIENFDTNILLYKNSPRPKNPIIIILDNDKGANRIINLGADPDNMIYVI